MLREGDRLTAVVLAVRDAATTVAIKNTRGLIPRAGHAWVRQIDPALSADVRRQLFRRGDVIQVRVTKVDPAGKFHILALDPEPLVQGASLTMDVCRGLVLTVGGGG